MPVDVKSLIAQAAKELLSQKNTGKLTVKEIAEKCGITRQTFYYHFDDIPDLLRWILEKDLKQTMRSAKSQGDGEARLRYLFMVAINAMPYMKKGMESQYHHEMEQLLTQYAQLLFQWMCDEEGLYETCTRGEVQLIIRYHSYAFMGLLKNWTQEDTDKLDRIVPVVYRLMTEGISPLS